MKNHKNKSNKYPNNGSGADDNLAAVLGVSAENPPETVESEAVTEPTVEPEGGDTEKIETTAPANDETAPDAPDEADGETPAPAAPPTAPPAPATAPQTLEEVLANLAGIPDPELRAKAEEQVRKLYQEANASKASKGWVKFDDEFRPLVEKLVSELTAKLGLVPEKQRIVITFPDGKIEVSRGMKGTKTGSSGTRQGFPAQWGKATDGSNEANSPSKLAETLGCQVNGKGAGYSDMVEAFDRQGHPVLELPAGVKFDSLLEKQTNPERRKRLEGLKGKIFRVKA